MTTAAEPTGGSPQVARGPGGGRRQGARPRQGRRPVRIAPGWTEGPGVPWSPVVCRSELAPVHPDSHASVVARPRRADAKAGLANGWSRVVAYVALTKPRIIELLLVTVEISPRAGMVFGLVLAVASVVWFAVLVNPLATALTALAIVMYVVGYTMVLKRRTPQNIVWGGAAGCMPVLIGWSAVTGSLTWAPLALFAVVFFWTPPHYWPLSMRFRSDYAAAGVPMLPVVAKDVPVAWQILAYAIAMVVASLVLVPLAGMTWVYAVVATVSGIWFLGLAVGVLQRARNPRPGRKLGEMRLFHGSITYLTLLFLAVAVDPILPM